MIKLFLLLALNAQAGLPGNSCTPLTVFDASGVCSETLSPSSFGLISSSSTNPDINFTISTTAYLTGARAALQLDSYSATINPAILTGRALGTRLAPTAVTANTTIGTFGSIGWNGVGMSTLSAAIAIRAEQTFSPTERRASIRFFTAPAGGGPLIARMGLSANGDFIIGEDRAATERLEVIGNVKISSALSVLNSSVTANAFFGNGSAMTNVTAQTNANLTGPVTSIGNATTIVGPVPNAAVDLSTVTAALGTKQATGNYITALTGAVTASGPGSASATLVGPIPASGVDLSTVTTALALKAALGGATFTGASGITSVAFTATGVNGNIVGAASGTFSGVFGNGSGVTSLTASNIVMGTLMTNNNLAGVSYSSGVIGYWAINGGSRAIIAGEIVQDSSGAVISPQSVVSAFALATTTVSGVAIDAIAIGAWGRIATNGVVLVKCGVANVCTKGRHVQAAGGTAATIGLGTGTATPVAGSSVGRWLADTAFNALGWVRLGSY